MSVLQPVIDQLKSTPILEWIAFTFAIIQVILAVKNSFYNFIAGIISVVFYSYIFFTAQLYAEAGLNLYYFIISIIGIYKWKSTTQKEILPISTCTKQEYFTLFIYIVLSTSCIYLLLKYLSDSNVPLADALVTATAFVGTWLLTKRKIENWLVLNISNAIAIPLQYYKGLMLTSVLTSLFFVLAIWGYLQWKTLLKR